MSEEMKTSCPEPVPDRDPPSVRLILAVKDFLHGHGRSVLLGLGGLLTLVWLAQGIYTVSSGESAAVLRFGKLVDDAVEPGLHLAFPAGVDTVTKARTGDVFRLEVAEDFGAGLALVTADENLIDVRLVVQYRITRLGDFLFRGEDPTAFVDQTVRSALVAAVAVTRVDDVLTFAKADLQNRVRKEAQERLDAYGTGVSLVAVSLQSITPPKEAAGAFRSVNDARAESAQVVSQASALGETSLRRAGGEAEQLLAQARAGADARQQQAQGAAERFDQLLRRQRVAPGQTRTELYNNSVRKALPRTRLIVLAPGETPDINLSLVEDGVQVPPRP